LSTYLPEEKIDDVSKAYRFAEESHKGQLRLSGEPFFEHPKQTALYLADLRLDANTISAALLHDVLEDCDVTYEELIDMFGEDVARLVDGVTKLTKAEIIGDGQFIPGSPQDDYHITDEEIAQAETLRKMLMAMAEDVRVVLIKLADRLHNMRTVSALPDSRREAMSRETLEIFAPLAHRLGIWEMKWMLEDLSFQQLDADSYKMISRRLNSKRAEREKYVDGIIGIIKKELNDAGIDSEVYGRPKHIYSIHKKYQRYAQSNKEISEIYDLFAVRIIVPEVRDCYGALGVIHTKWHPLPGQFDDYIASPKDNLYQSLHTAVLCEGSAPVEVQIRTKDMHQVAEYGVAAHWLYKEGGDHDTKFEEKMVWLRQLLDWQRDIGGAVEFVESFKTDIFQNQVFVYTPNGDVVELPFESTPLDFAYRIHTDVGHSCVGAKVNGKLVSLNYKLGNGDTIHIMTSKTVRGPSLDWINSSLGYTKTSSAKSKIRQWFNRQERQSNVVRGKELFQTLMRRLDVSLDEASVKKIFNRVNVDDLYADLGEGSLTSEKFISKISLRDEAPNIVVEGIIPKSGPASGLQVLGVGDLLTSIARCCNPIMGDAIVGFITRGRGVTVHQKHCANILSEDESERVVPVDWGETKNLYPVRIQVECWDRVGLLGDVTSAVSNQRVNIANINSEEYDDMSVISLTVYISNIDELNKLCTKLEVVSGVINVIRLRNLAK
jgi:GTP pyrophosphokinase